MDAQRHQAHQRMHINLILWRKSLADLRVCVWGGANQLETTRHTCELAMDSKGLVP